MSSPPGTCESDELWDWALTVGGDTPVLPQTAAVYVEDGEAVSAGPLVEEDVVGPPVHDVVVPVPGEGGGGHPRHPAHQLLLLPPGGVDGPLPDGEAGAVLDLHYDRPPDRSAGVAVISGAGVAARTVPGDGTQAQHCSPLLCQLPAVEVGPGAGAGGTAPLQPRAWGPCKSQNYQILSVTLTVSLSLSLALTNVKISPDQLQTFQP